MLTGTADELLLSVLSSGPSPFLVACVGLSCPGGVPVEHWQSVIPGASAQPEPGIQRVRYKSPPIACQIHETAAPTSITSVGTAIKKGNAPSDNLRLQ